MGLGVDGSASNDSSHLLAEARQALLLQRVMGNPRPHRPAGLGTGHPGRRVRPGRDDIGSLAPNMAADIIAFDLNALGYAGGAVHDPVAALVFCHPQNVDFSLVNGRLLVKDGQPVQVDLPMLIEEHNRVARELVN